MERISIPVKNETVGFSNNTLIASIFFALTIGLFIGSVFAANITLPAPEGRESALGAVGNVDIEGGNPLLAQEETNDVAPLPPEAKTPLPKKTESAQETNNNVVENISVDSLALYARKLELENTAKEQILEIKRSTQSIEQLKKESVSLIAEFNFNCGNWESDCAALYKAGLEKNNDSYEQALAVRATLYEGLANTERLLVAIE